MTPQEILTPVLLDGLARPSEPERQGRMNELRRRWQKQLGPPDSDVEPAPGESHVLEDNIVQFSTELPGVRLRGMDEVRCVLIAGDGEAGYRLNQGLVKKVCVPGRLSCVLAPSPAACQAARHLFPAAEFLIFPRDDIQAVLQAPDGRGVFKQLLRARVPKRTLVPFNFLLPAAANMFFGRADALETLRAEGDTSFAIAGPSRLGKTSLVNQYQRLLVRTGDPRMHCRFYIDFLDCGDHTDDGIARFVAMKVDPTRDSVRTTAFGSYRQRSGYSHSLLSFFRQKSHELGRPLELLLDEVDEVCFTKAFEIIGEAARLGLVRLVACGRGTLFRAMLGSDSPLAERLELLRLEPLSQSETHGLATQPLEDLGFRLREPLRLASDVFRCTMGLPHMIQFYGHKLVDLAITHGTDTITSDLVKQVASSFEAVQFLTVPFRRLRNELRSLAFALVKSAREHFSVPDVCEVAATDGVALQSDRAQELCNDLVFEGILIWREGRYALASCALPGYLSSLGLVP